MSAVILRAAPRQSCHHLVKSWRKFLKQEHRYMLRRGSNFFHVHSPMTWHDMYISLYVHQTTVISIWFHGPHDDLWIHLCIINTARLFSFYFQTINTIVWNKTLLYTFICILLRIKPLIVQWSLYIPSSGHYMYRTVVIICTVQWSIHVPSSGHYMYRPVVSTCTVQWSL
jgi:hypothetical protein